MSQLPVNLEAYLHTHEQLREAVGEWTDEQLKWKAAPESWSVTEVIAHLVDHSVVIAFRLREILSGSSVRLPAFSQDAWIAGQRSNDGNVHDYLKLFQSLLEYNSGIFRRLTPEDWEKTGVNAKGDTVTLPQIVHSFTAHVQNHLEQIGRTKSALTTETAN
ncbi:DinB family protein [Paenibacillus sp. 1011MAR3C5]|uniref:DinB family protein n=1 Tax=Paenibacillus sp. 1011MAR3C5 TaxID=1675787 RepID=UPI000E6C2CD5|nr:DinB family protein [Paenibacillus sp. 1011MAR3C5]RJE90358.1 DinB family protein [Paenibacillus sp. 1011MAR3C5]